MTDTREKMDDISFEARAALYEMTLSKNATEPLAVVLRRHHMEHIYQEIWQRIRGTMNMTPTLLLTLCQWYDDFTPLQLEYAAMGLEASIPQKARRTGDIVLEIAEANAAMGAVNEQLAKALSDGKVTKAEVVEVARRANRAMREVYDIINAAGRMK